MAIRKELIGDVSQKVVLKLDIKDFFDDISVPHLLHQLEQWIKPSIKAQFHYDAATVEQIAFFFRYLSGDKRGIPQTENDILGGFIGYLYLLFADFAFCKEVQRDKNLFEGYSIIRYVDDVYIFLDFKKEVPQSDREILIDTLSARIADILYYKLGLKLNTKSRLFWLCDRKDVKELERNLKKVSTGHYIYKPDSDIDPQDRVDNILDELRKLKAARMGTYFVLESSIEDDILKEVFDRPVDQLLNKQSNLDEIREIFKDFNFDYVKVCPFEITIIMLKDPQIKEAYRRFLLKKKYLPTDDVDLILKFLAQVGFGDQELLNKLKQNKHMDRIVELISAKSIMSDYPGYYHLDSIKAMSLSSCPHVIDQIRLRVMSQKLESYSIALNHLLNEIHAICLLKDTFTRKSHKEYNVNDVMDFLIKQGLPPETSNDIRNLFDRRNINQVSHPGSSTSITWAVSPKEYEEYYNWVGQCLKLIL